MIPKAPWLLPLLLLTFSACSSPESGSPPESASTSAQPVTAGSSQDQMPAQAADTGTASLGPISSRGEPVAESGTSAPAGGSIDFDLPSGWQSEPPSSSMRLVQATIPGSAGTGSLAVFFFGPGGGGGVDANIQRWIDQMEPAPGSAPKPETFETRKGFKVTMIDVRGTIKPSTMGTGPATEQPGSRLLGAVVEGPGGPWFFKATGPDATIKSGREAFLAMLKSVRSK